MTVLGGRVWYLPGRTKACIVSMAVPALVIDHGPILLRRVAVFHFPHVVRMYMFVIVPEIEPERIGYGGKASGRSGGPGDVAEVLG